MNKWSMQVKNEYEKVRLRTALTRLGQWERTELHQADRQLRQVRHDLDHLQAYRAVSNTHSFSRAAAQNLQSAVGELESDKQDGGDVAQLSTKGLCLPGISARGKLSPRTSSSTLNSDSSSKVSDGIASPRSSVSGESLGGVPSTSQGPAKSVTQGISSLKLHNGGACGSSEAGHKKDAKGAQSGGKANPYSSTTAKKDNKKVSFDMFPKISVFTSDSSPGESMSESANDVEKPTSLMGRFRAAANRVIEEKRVEAPVSMAAVVQQVVERRREDLRSKLQDVPEPSAGKRLTSWAGLMNGASRWKQYVAKRKPRGTLEAFVPTFSPRFRRLPPREGHQRSSVFPGNCKTTHALKNFMAAQMTDMLASWSPSNRRVLRSRKLKETIPAIDFVDRTRTTSAIFRDFRHFQEERRKTEVRPRRRKGNDDENEEEDNEENEDEDEGEDEGENDDADEWDCGLPEVSI